eukprot:CAMPEP_0184488682 /NCGR_PEP_ID=MMETSP0113_2-20130426/13084_1 /TAXON_ID=91329 /ORGANISM="Norrisiella sphaerica, Strain BC52" /LENGTH=308 /DNA_ID=CAMNT_0026871643 /DNA_START=90 /DNA_END=1016 /DNA_ORIENTATION=-
MSDGIDVDIKIAQAVRFAQREFKDTVESLVRNQRALTTKISELENKVQELSGRLHRSQVVRRATRVLRMRQRRAAQDGGDAKHGVGSQQGPITASHQAPQKKRMTSKRELRGILRQPQGFKVFHKFCEKEACGGNPIFWRKCNEFIDECTCTLEDISQLCAAGMDPSELFLAPAQPDPALQLAKTIFYDFIVPGSANELALSKGLVNRITLAVHRLLRTVNKTSLTAVMKGLQDAQAEIFAFMANYTFRRFQASEMYSEYRATNPLETKTLDLEDAGDGGAGSSGSGAGTGGAGRLLGMLKSHLPFAQ